VDLVRPTSPAWASLLFPLFFHHFPILFFGILFYFVNIVNYVPYYEFSFKLTFPLPDRAGYSNFSIHQGLFLPVFSASISIERNLDSVNLKDSDKFDDLE